MSDTLTLVFGFSVLLMAVVLPVYWVLLTWITPKTVVERYVCPPHFSEFEAIAYRHFPSSLIRTNLLSMAIAIPIGRRIRNFGDINKRVPLWFNVACRVYIYFVLGYSILCMTTMGILALGIKLGVLS